VSGLGLIPQEVTDEWASFAAGRSCHDTGVILGDVQMAPALGADGADEALGRLRVLRVFVQHYNGQRPHRALNLKPPDPEQPTLMLASLIRPGDVTRRDRLAD
jgi:hypothetical protein